MAKEVAAFVGAQGKTVPLQEAGRIVVYQRSQGKWNILREKKFSLGEQQSLKELRLKMAELLSFLDNCQIFVGLSVSGVPYYELEKADCSIWEYNGRPIDFLDYVLLHEENGTKKVVKDKGIPSPQEKGNGVYSISLKELQEKDQGLTSKQVLISFFRQVPFVQLEVTCSHLPPWLEAECLNGNIALDVKRMNSKELKVIITKNCCG